MREWHLEGVLARTVRLILIGLVSVACAILAECCGQAWFSSDGATWREVDLVGESKTAALAAWVDDLAVIVGGVGCRRSDFSMLGFDCSQGVAWTSADGRSWEPHDIGQEPSAYLVSEGPLGFLAIGSDDVWISADAADWRRAAADVERPLAHVLETEANFLITGYKPPSTIVMWTSPDAMTWQRSSHALPHGAATVSAVVAAGGSLAVQVIRTLGNTADPGRAYALVFDDKAGWSVPSEGAPEALGVTAVAGVLVAVGGSQGVAEVWTSLDGTNWQSVAAPPSRELVVAAAWADQVVAVDLERGVWLGSVGP